MRTMSSKLLVESYAAYGANPTPSPFAEVYSSLQLKMVDGQENPLAVIYDMKFYEVQDYLIFAYTSPFFLTMISNKTFIDKLPADMQKIVREAADEIIPYAFEWQEKFNKSRLDKMVQSKKELKVVYLTSEQIAMFKEISQKTHQIFLDIGGEDAKQILDALMTDIENYSK
jgi:TRAP-type C4-dicarboxylate transport system substrate-binding protein